MLVAEVAEVDGTRYGDHLPHAGRRPAGDDVPHALATCQEEGPTLEPHNSHHTHTHVINHIHNQMPSFVHPFLETCLSSSPEAASTISIRVLCDPSVFFANFLLVAVILKQFLPSFFF